MKAESCATKGCPTRTRSRFCWRCRRRRRVESARAFRSLPERLRSKIDPSGPQFEGTPCWVWTAAATSRGYGSVWDRGSMRQAHLVVFEVVIRGGRKLRGKRRELDHRCRNRLCVNPTHLKPVTRGENNRRSTCWHHLVGERRQAL